MDNIKSSNSFSVISNTSMIIDSSTSRITNFNGTYISDIGNDVKIIIGSQTATTTIYSTWDLISNSFNLASYADKRESLLVDAIRNFLRKANLAELNEALDNEEIDEGEFERELNENENKYVITLRNINSVENSRIIVDLVEKIGHDLKDFTTSDISEMFSIKETQLISLIKDFQFPQSQKHG